MFKKHVSVIQSLEVLTCDTIKCLDREYEGQTLHSHLMSLRHPLVSTEGLPTKGLIHAVNFSSQGPHVGSEVLVAVYKDQKELVQSLLHILPSFIKREISDQAMDAWCHHQTELPQVTWNTDKNGNWLGTWSTGDDTVFRDLLNEEMEGEIMFDNLEIMERTQRILSAEDASHHSFANSRHTVPSSTVSAGSDTSTTTVPQAQEDGGQAS